MNDVRDRMTGFLTALPVTQRITLGAAAVGLVMVSVWFFSWISAPAMTVLASGLETADMATIVDQLEASNTPYEIGAGGTTVMVPRDQLYTTRAALATAGIASGEAGEGWELLDDQGIAISDFQQQANYQRALEGELARTLSAMDGIDAATVHLVLPEDRLFTEQQEPRSAPVLLDTRRDLSAEEIEAVVFMVSSAVEGLGPDGITVADAAGTVLHAPGESGGTASGASRQLRETRAYESALAADIQRLLATATGSTASVVVRAELDFDTTQTNVRSYDPASQVATSEQTIEEEYTGTGGVEAGTIGVDGGPESDGGEAATTDYTRSEVLREYGVNETTTVTTNAPGQVEGLSVAIVMDDGTVTGAAVPADDQVAALVAAAVGLDEARGDTVAVTRVPFPEATDDPAMAEAGTDLMAMVTQVGSVLVLLVVATALLLMSRRREDSALPELAGGDADLPALAAADGGLEQARERVLVADAREVGSQPATESAMAPATTAVAVADDGARREVEQLVDKQPEEIANLLRSWLADTN